MVKLNKIIFKSEILGDNYAQLGKANGTSWDQKKILLSYDKKQGFQVVTLNLFQLFLRRVFGCYSSTRLSIVCKALDRFKLSKFALKGEKLKKYESFEKRIKELWSKTYPQKPMPSIVHSTTVILGNVSRLEDAELICFADSHTSGSFSRVIGDVTNQYHKDGDEISIEGAQTGMRVKKRSGHSHQLKFVNPEFPVQGHEPPGVEKYTKPIFKETDKMHNDLIKLWEEFEKEVPKDNKFTKEQIQELEEKTKNFLKKLLPFFDFFYLKPQTSKMKFEETSEFIQHIFQLIKEGTLNSDSKTFLYALSKIPVSLEKQQHKARYAHVNKDHELFSGETERNDSLCEEIERHCDGKRRMFVIVGGLHILKSKVYGKLHLIPNIQAAFEKRKFAIVVPKKIMKQFEIAKLNSDLHRIPHPVLGG